MRSLFLPSSLRILESLSFTRSLFAFDFDGTLSEIVEKPSQAVIRTSTSRLLMDLSARVPVAILSGRSLADLRQRLPFRPRYLIGNHGVEGLDSPEPSLIRVREICRAWKHRLQSRLLRRSSLAGVAIEDKTYSLAIHFRQCRSRQEAKLNILGAVSNLSPPPRIILGKSVVNLVPSGAPHKGVALVELMQRLGVRSAFYIGDDDTDEDVFALPDSRILTVRVGQKRTSRAQYFIPRQSDINKVLRKLIQFHRKERTQ